MNSFQFTGRVSNVLRGIGSSVSSQSLGTAGDARCAGGTGAGSLVLSGLMDLGGGTGLLPGSERDRRRGSLLAVMVAGAGGRRTRVNGMTGTKVPVSLGEICTTGTDRTGDGAVRMTGDGDLVGNWLLSVSFLSLAISFRAVCADLPLLSTGLGGREDFGS